MKEKILVFLKGKFPGTSETYLKGVADHYSKTITTEEGITTTFTDGVIDFLSLNASLLQKEGDRRATAATQTAVKNFQEKHGLDENGIKIVDQKLDPKPDLITDDDMPQWAKTQKEETDKIINELKGKLEKSDEEKILAEMSGKVKSHEKLKDIPASFLEGRSLNAKTTEEVEAVVTKIESDYAAFTQEMVEKKLIIDPPRSSGDLGEKDSEIGKEIALDRNKGIQQDVGVPGKEI